LIGLSRKEILELASGMDKATAEVIAKIILANNEKLVDDINEELGKKIAMGGF
jgi:predicted transcriptional regulator